MKFILLFLLFSISNIFANDGAFFASGNQLIPVSETDIMVRKEILTLKKVNNKFIDVTVYYEFSNPKEEKNLIVGFEAFSPYGDVDGTPKNGQHPYMHNFTVELNNFQLKYEIAFVDDKSYSENGVIKGKKLKDVINNINDVNNVDFFYVYHFKAKFKKGLNIIKHTYRYDISGSIDYNYDFEYVLTAANRWGNKQIDDFKLIIDMGEFETFNINKSFFTNKLDWKMDGIGKSENVKGAKNTSIENDALKFHIQQGKIVFEKKSFKPTGELFVYSQRFMGFENFEYLPFSYYQVDNIAKPKNDFELKILKNLPYARRGFVFKNADLKNYYEKLDWYIPNPQYIPELNTLNKLEKEWLLNLK